MSRDRGVIRKMRSKSAIRKVRLQESVPDDIEMALSADEEFSSVLKEDRNEDSSDENSVGDNETDGERKVSTTYDIDTHSITFQSQFSPPPSDEEESDEHVDLGSDVDDDIDDFTITTEHEIKASDYLHATGATVTSSSTGFSGLSSDEEEKLADKRPSHHAESKVGEISFEDALKFGGDTNNNVLKVDDPRDNVLMNVPVAGMGTIMGKSKSRERTLEQQCAQAKRSQLQITYGELSALGKTDKNDVEKPSAFIIAVSLLRSLFTCIMVLQTINNRVKNTAVITSFNIIAISTNCCVCSLINTCSVVVRVASLAFSNRLSIDLITLFVLAFGLTTGISQLALCRP